MGLPKAKVPPGSRANSTLIVSAEARYESLSKPISTTLSPSELMSGTAFEADELYQNAGEKKDTASRRGRPAAQARKSAQRQRHLEERPTTTPLV